MNLYERFIEAMTHTGEERENILIRLILDAIARETDYRLHRELMANMTARFVETNQALRKSLDEVEKLATQDFLTGLHNRSYFSKVAEYELDKHVRAASDLCLILFDIDHFKHINDTYGHDIGDIALIEITKAVKHRLRKTDTFARWGGEEFIILLPDTSLDEALHLAEDLRMTLEHLTITGLPQQTTSSFGVALYTTLDDLASFIKRADESLYHAKQSGRNIVCASKVCGGTNGD